MSSIAGVLEQWKGGVGAFLVWWRDELWGLVPESVRARLGASSGSTVIAARGSVYRVLEELGGRSRVLGEALPLPDAVATAARAKAAAPTTRIGFRLSAQGSFRRSVELPVAARSDAANILALDLERSTPFKLKDVYTATYVEEAPGVGGKIKAVQLVAKREAIDPILSELRAAGLPPDFVDCWDEDGRTALPINFLAPGAGAQSGIARFATAPILMGGLAALLAVTALVLTLSRSQSALNEVQERVAETRTKAATVRRALETSDAAVAELTRLQRQKLLQVPTVETVEELTKLLPDSVWIADLRLEGDVLDLSGLAKSGAALLPMFEKSKLFAEATLTAPLTFDPQEDKERFSVRLRVRRPGAETKGGTITGTSSIGPEDKP